MNQMTEDPKQPERQSYSRTYQTPRLSIYGAVRELTSGGAGTQQEPNPGKGNQPPGKRP